MSWRLPEGLGGMVMLRTLDESGYKSLMSPATREGGDGRRRRRGTASVATGVFGSGQVGRLVGSLSPGCCLSPGTHRSLTSRPPHRSPDLDLGDERKFCAPLASPNDRSVMSSPPES